MSNYNVAEVKMIMRLGYESAFACKPPSKVQHQLDKISTEIFSPLEKFFSVNVISEDNETICTMQGENSRLLSMLEKTKTSGVQLQEIIDKLTTDNQSISHNWQNCLEGNKNLKEYADKKDAQIDTLLEILKGVTDGITNSK